MHLVYVERSDSLLKLHDWVPGQFLDTIAQISGVTSTPRPDLKCWESFVGGNTMECPFQMDSEKYFLLIYSLLGKKVKTSCDANSDVLLKQIKQEIEKYLHKLHYFVK
jgi:hypothetical protein